MSSVAGASAAAPRSSIRSLSQRCYRQNCPRWRATSVVPLGLFRVVSRPRRGTSTVNSAATVRIHRSCEPRSLALSQYNYKGSTYTAGELIEELIRTGLAAPAARDMDTDEVLDQIAEANAVERSGDAMTFPVKL